MNPIDHAIEVFDRQYQDKGLSAQRRYPNESLIQFLASRFFQLPEAERRAIHILEVGCGSGANLWMMAKEGFSTYGVDSSAKALDLARKHLAEKWGVTAELREGSFTKLPYDDRSFDVVVDIVSLQHIPLEAGSLALQEVRRVLKPGGAFFSYRLSDHSVMYEHSGGKRIDAVTVDNIANAELPLSGNGPVSFLSPGSARMMYKNASFEIEEIERVGRTYSDGKYVEYLAISARAPL